MSEDQKTAIIFNIQKFSLHDGPGIRTVVFTKGCPLRCKWCANPESQNPKIQILWDRHKCLNCGVCAASCSFGAVTADRQGIRIDDRLCTGCKTCATKCPGNALKSEGEVKTVAQILDICLQDQDFYEESNGGVTLSGGEAFMHPDFSIALLKALHEHGIHTAVETTGYAAPELFDRVAEHLDLILFDIKHWDEERHREGTGVSNRVILENMKRAIDAGYDVLPRLPVIPGFNDLLSDAEGFAGRLKEAGAHQVQLLPFHQFGEKKYEELGKDYEYTDIPALHQEDLTAYLQIFLNHNIHAFF